MFLGAAAFSALAFFPTHIALVIGNSVAQPVSEKSDALLANKLARSERDEIMRTQALLDSISPIIFATSSPTDTISAALALRPSGVRIDRISFADTDNGSITLSGISPGRDNINLYKEALTKSGLFKSVSVPVGTLVGADDGKFIITLSGTF